MARYRLRTWMREHAPAAAAGLFPPGRRDCGDHEWFRHDEATDRCYHCRTDRPHQATPLIVGSPEWLMLVKAAKSGSQPAKDALMRRLAEHRVATADTERLAEQVLQTA